MSGSNGVEWNLNTQLMHESDDVYAKLTKYQPTTNVPSKCSEEKLRNLWDPETSFDVHNRDQGIHANLFLMNSFASKHGADTKTGGLTSTGTTVGECKLFSTLHSLTMIEPRVLDNYSKLGVFYEGFLERKETREVLEGGQFHKYFIKPLDRSSQIASK
ncbi:hypothetical protein TrST_g532 [Triparma strigata]|uniref:Uncharacterized protein n=1 Tax=Triparma strigata TaxID=1606541 RepID=A0A9W7AAF8_9STRA|nr:hypothetical protein TrST_g532 [Triparma strigata]